MRPNALDDRSAMLPGPPAIAPGEAPGAWVAYIYDDAGRLAARCTLSEHAIVTARRAPGRSDGPGEVTFMIYSGDTGEWAGAAWGRRRVESVFMSDTPTTPDPADPDAPVDPDDDPAAPADDDL